MAITQSQSNVPGSVCNMAVGSYITTGTAAAIAITTGFRPRYVKVVNETGLAVGEWFEGMTDDHAIKWLDNGDGTADLQKITSLGITDSANGFVIGLDTDINVTSEQLRWIALG